MGLLGETAKLEEIPVEGFKVIKFESEGRSSTRAASYLVVIAPVDSKGSQRSSQYSYCVDESGVIRRSPKKGALADATCSPLVIPEDPAMVEEHRKIDEMIKRHQEMDKKERQMREGDEWKRMQRQMEQDEYRREMEPNR
jgi:hypothetical protein